MTDAEDVDGADNLSEEMSNHSTFINGNQPSILQPCLSLFPMSEMSK